MKFLNIILEHFLVIMLILSFKSTLAELLLNDGVLSKDYGNNADGNYTLECRAGNKTTGMFFFYNIVLIYSLPQFQIEFYVRKMRQSISMPITMPHLACVVHATAWVLQQALYRSTLRLARETWNVLSEMVKLVSNSYKFKSMAKKPKCLHMMPKSMPSIGIDFLGTLRIGYFSKAKKSSKSSLLCDFCYVFK